MELRTTTPAGDEVLLGELGRLRWRALLDDRSGADSIASTLGPLVQRDAEAVEALERWAASTADPERFRRETERLADRLTPFDGLSRLANEVLAQHEARWPEPRTATLKTLFASYLEIRNRLVNAHLGLVHLAVNRLKVPPSRHDDMLHEGIFGLVRALECFDPTRGAKFSTYAMYWIRTEIIRARTHQEREIRIPSHILANRRAYTRALAALDQGQPADQLRDLARQAAGLTERQLRVVESVPQTHASELVEPPHPGVTDPSTDLHRRQMLDRLEHALPVLSERERAIIEHRFELDGKPHRTLQELAQELGLSRERIRQLQLAALRKLRSRLQTPRPLPFADSRAAAVRAA